MKYFFVIYGNVLRSPEICYKCVAHSHTLSSRYPFLCLCLSRCQCHTHMKMFYKQFSSWFLCVFVHSFNYLAIKYDEPRSFSLYLPLSLSRTREESLVVAAWLCLFPHCRHFMATCWGDRVSLWLPCQLPLLT